MQTGWKETEAQEVPPEASTLSEYLDDLKMTFYSTLEVCGRKSFRLGASTHLVSFVMPSDPSSQGSRSFCSYPSSSSFTWCLQLGFVGAQVGLLPDALTHIYTYLCWSLCLILVSTSYFWFLLQYLGRRPGLLVAIGGFFATLTYAITLRILGLNPKTKKTGTRSRVRPVRKRADWGLQTDKFITWMLRPCFTGSEHSLYN